MLLFGKALSTHNASLHPGVKRGTGNCQGSLMKCWQVVCDRLVVHPRGSGITCNPLELHKLGLALAGRATWLECRLNLPNSFNAGYSKHL